MTKTQTLFQSYKRRWAVYSKPELKGKVLCEGSESLCRRFYKSNGGRKANLSLGYELILGGGR